MAATQSTSSVYKPSDPNKAYPLLDILKDLPPGRGYLVVQATREVFGTQGSYHALLTPELQMYCDNDHCQGTRFFDCIDDFGQILTQD